MPGTLLWGWDNTNKVWIPLQVDANGYVKVDMSNVNLDDLADVQIPTPTDKDILYFDDATDLWKSKPPVLSDLGIDADKNWNAKGITNLAKLVMAATQTISDVDFNSKFLARPLMAWCGLANATMSPLQNILAFADKVSGYTVTVTPAPDSGTIAEMFDGKTGTYARWLAASLPAVIQIDLDKEYNLQHLFGVGFYTQYAQSVKIEAYDGRTTTWATILDTATNIYTSVVVPKYKNYVTKVKFTIGNAYTTDIRVTHLVDGNTADVKGYYVYKGGDIMYGLLDAPSFRIRDTKTPATAAATGTTGDICWDASYIYVCVATNTWKRAAIATW